MKRYIRSSEHTKIELPEIIINIDITFFVKSSVTASSDNLQNLPIANNTERSQVSDIFRSYMQSVINVIEGEGFTEMERHPSNGKNSQSSYYMFCYENDFYVQRVKVVFTLRLSNHLIHMKPADQNQQVANARQEDWFRRKIQRYKWLSDSNDDLILVPAYVTYDGHYVDKYIEILRMVKARMVQLKEDFPSEEPSTYSNT